MTTHNEIRENVSRAYAQAVSSCCNGGRAADRSPKGYVVKLAGYDEEQLRGLPDDAVVNSFGCGDPLAYSDVRPGDVVLDLGCGAGIDILIAARRVGPTGHAIGIDMTDEMLDRARQTIRESGLTNVEVRKGFIEDLPVDSASVDWVISNCVINLSPEKERVFAEIARVLKPGGQMLVADIVAAGLPEAVLQNLELYNSCVGGAIGEEAYLEGLQRAGLINTIIRARIEYDVAHLFGLLESDLRDGGHAGRCCTAGAIDAETMRDLAAQCEGKVWSAKIYAQKPT